MAYRIPTLMVPRPSNHVAAPASLLLANADPLGLVVTLPNELTLENDGWAMLAPYCDTRMQGTPENPEAFRQRFPEVPLDAQGRVTVIQRVDRESATALANEFNSLTARVRRFFRGAPIYHGHPDVPGMQSRYPDASEHGLISRLEAREQGLYCLPIFNARGSDLLGTKPGLGFSAYWKGEPDSAEGGHLVYKPTRFLSAGLTSTPNLPVELLNTAPEMELKKLIALLVALKAPGLALANDATEDQVTAAIEGLAPHLATSVTLANDKTTLTTERDQLRVQFENERKAHVGSLLGAAVADGRITEAERPTWEQRLGANFANESEALAKLTPKHKTAPAADGNRSAVTGAAAAERELIALANAKIDATPSLPWQKAWDLAIAEKPALFAALTEPKK